MKRKLLLIIGIVTFLTMNMMSLTAQSNSDSLSVGDKVSQNPLVEKTERVITDTIQNAQPEWSLSFGKIFWAIIIFVIGFFVIKYLTNFLSALAERWTRSRLIIKGLIPVTRVVSWIIVSYIIIVDVFAPPMATVVALAASAGIAVGFASQDILKNTFGGIMIIFDRPFQVGDKIEVGNYYGEVLAIGLRTVRIVTPDDSVVAIPNSDIVNQSVSNANTGESNCQVVAEFYLPGSIDIQKTKKIAYRAAAVSKYVYLNKPIVVVFKNEAHQGRSLLKMRLKAYVLDIRYEFPFSSEMTEFVLGELLKQRLITAEDLDYMRTSVISDAEYHAN